MRVTCSWRCKCGIQVKVVGELDTNNQASQVAGCPRCGDEQRVYVEKILSISAIEVPVAPADSH